MCVPVALLRITCVLDLRCRQTHAYSSSFHMSQWELRNDMVQPRTRSKIVRNRCQRPLIGSVSQGSLVDCQYLSGGGCGCGAAAVVDKIQPTLLSVNEIYCRRPVVWWCPVGFYWSICDEWYTYLFVVRSASCDGA